MVMAMTFHLCSSKAGSQFIQVYNPQCGVAAGTALKLPKSSNVLLQWVSREERRIGGCEDRGERSL
jgi:hypothetical protein